jgi:ABC-type phosphate/phosphonate transport system permease subunit
LYAIILFIFSKGDEKKIKQAWDSIRYAIIGVILTIFLLFIFPIVFQKLHIPGYKVYTAKNVFKRASDILKQTFTAFKKTNSSSSIDPTYTDGL